MRIRTLVSVTFAALAITACGDNATAPTSPSSRFAAPAAPHLDLTATNTDINTLIDQLFTSPIVRLYVHAEWNWLAAQVVQCPSTTSVLRLQASLNQLTTYLQASVPRNNTAKALLLRQLISDMSSYVNEAIGDCTAA